MEITKKFIKESINRETNSRSSFENLSFTSQKNNYSIFQSIDSAVRFLVPKSALGFRGQVNSMTYVILLQIVVIVCQLILLGYSVLKLIERY